MTLRDIKAEIEQHSYARILSDEQFRFAGLKRKGYRLSRNGFHVIKEPVEKIVFVVL